MNFGQAFLLLFALAKVADARVEHQTPKLRKLQTSRNKNDWYVAGFDEELGECTGAVCGMWGDPHMISCDGLGFDCNAVGVFTMMKNFLYNIQGHFIHVGTQEIHRLIDNNRFPKASYATDIAIDFIENESLPTMQFSIPEFVNDDDMPPSERGCREDIVYDVDIAGQPRTEEETIVACRERCESIEGCVAFTYVADGGCHVADDAARAMHKPEGWSRTVSGYVDRCGHPAKYEAIEGTEVDKAKVIGNGSGNGKVKNRRGEGCPMLFYMDGEIQDISEVPDEGYLYGSEGSANFVKLHQWNKIKIGLTTAAGNYAEIMIETDGEGPGELWGCHWNMWTCLPAAEEASFQGSTGLMGSPDGDTSNDWVSPEGEIITLPNKPKQLRTQTAYDYCLDNWCVAQEDNIIMPPAGQTFDSIKCMDEDYYEPEDPLCILSADKIIEACKDKPLLLIDACHVDCCSGGCDQIDDVIDEVKEYSEDDDGVEYKTPDPKPPMCDDDGFESTGDSACPSSEGSVVEVIHQTADIPEDEPILYGIAFSPPSDDDHGREVKFRVANPYDSNADVYVRYEKKVGLYANDPACDSLPGTIPDCDVAAPEITVGCIEYPGVAPFALVDVYFASVDPFVEENADPETEVEKCCKPPEYAGNGIGVIKYSFKIECSCPDSTDE